MQLAVSDWGGGLRRLRRACLVVAVLSGLNKTQLMSNDRRFRAAEAFFVHFSLSELVSFMAGAIITK